MGSMALLFIFKYLVKELGIGGEWSGRRCDWGGERVWNRRGSNE